MAWGSTVPACLNGLVAALTPGGVTVLKGPSVGASARTEVILVGFSPDGPAVDVILRAGDAALASQREKYVVHCRIEVLRGGTNALDDATTRAMQILALVGEALTLHPTLSEAVMLAQLAAWSLELQPSPRGSTVIVPFDVDVDALTPQ